MQNNRNPRNFEPPDISEPAANSELHACAEQLELLEGVYADPARLLPIAEAAGIGAELFTDDMKILWLATDVGRALPADRLFSLCRLALRRNHYWDRDATASEYGKRSGWNDANLERLFTSMFASTMWVRHHAARLIDLRQRQREAHEHLRYAMRLLTTEAA